MRVKGFLQEPEAGTTTAQQLLTMHERVGTTVLLGSYAYATSSGTAAFDLSMGAAFWEDVTTRWLFGIDYGRTHPKALQFLRDKPNAEVRIHDGAWVVNQPGFVPRRDFHMKAAFLLNQAQHKYGMVAGSGNFSANGLAQSVECGVSLFVDNDAPTYARTFRRARMATESLWENATPLADVLDQYGAAWVEKKVPQAEHQVEPDFDEVETFWIEAGYVTRNRGDNRPGNQIDMPRGMNRFFGFHAPADQAINSTIGAITFMTPIGETVTRNLRLGNNLMEKVTLPIPESYGFDMYDGKVLIFRAEGAEHRLWALEEADFEAAFGDRLAGVKVMGSGRRYGYIEE